MGRIKGHEWQTEFSDLMRGIAGAFLFGAPFLYTMEVWWKGNFTSPPRMMLILGMAYMALVLLNIKGGFRAEQPRSRTQILVESAEGLAIALFTATLSLTLLDIVHVETGIDAIMGRLITLSLPYSIGVGIANNLLLRVGDDEADSDKKRGHPLRSTLSDAGAALLGAIVVGSSIAPTDEIPMISSSLEPTRLLLIMASSLLLSYIIVFEANFGAQRQRRSQSGLFQGPISETVAAYLIALAASAFMLWLFQVIRVGDPINQWVSYIIVLGLPCTIGGAAGRLAV
ncbi:MULTISPECIES: TIGR02587 family membrane protein [Cyanophyceae]|uniref:TIGR02587 family membrane protein n=1 Tax=Cyanophyceae TaxID=3028117 RepID=UPI001685D8C1|nr:MULTISPECIES: TIGR02587 family membrane protein [Cyanophyceae]MBD1915025.1 TIGR02587 family membrane protein [Phormidium sp. FACHB-77]MBD2029334.1 TIGR02587 family membrane protein [Phormidium sp. FACHB-322]MBD2053193.1 TIGR02587 family membrane protein [Leptolyngbya sp. FACHB-60]